MSAEAQEEPKPDLRRHLAEYRCQLVLADQKAIDDYDKTVVAIAGGALAISLTFVKDIVGDGPVSSASHLFTSWCLLSGSIGSTLASFLCSHAALRHAIGRVDDLSIYTSERRGGMYAMGVRILNVIGLLALVGGIILMLNFVRLNLEVRHDRRHHTDQRPPQTDESDATASATSAGAATTTSTTPASGARIAPAPGNEERISTSSSTAPADEEAVSRP